MCLDGKVASLFGVLEAANDPFVLPLIYMIVYHALCTAHHGSFVRDSLKFLVLQLFGDRMLGILRLVLNLILQVLLLNHLQLVVHNSPRQLRVKPLQQIVGGMRSTVHNWVILSKAEIHVQLGEQFLQMIPIANFLLQFETIVELVHFDLVWVVARQDLRKKPPIGEISLWISDLVGQVETVEPHVHLSG